MRMSERICVDTARFSAGDDVVGKNDDGAKSGLGGAASCSSSSASACSIAR